MDTSPLPLIFAICSGILGAFTMLQITGVSYPGKTPFTNIWAIVLAVIGGTISGIISLYVSSWLYKVTGRWLKGKGDGKTVRTAVGWSYYPSVVSGILYLLGIIVSKSLILKFVFVFLSLVVGVWGFIIFLHLLSEAHEFSVWKALATILLAILLVIALFALISIIISLFFLGPLNTQL